MQWLKDGLSIDETRISAIIVAFYITLGFAMYQVVTVGDIAQNLLMLLSAELGAFTGIKVFESITTNKKIETSEKYRPDVESNTAKPNLP